MNDLNDVISRQEMRCEQFIIHVSENKNATAVERLDLLALLEDLVRLKAERQRLEDELALQLAA